MNFRKQITQIAAVPAVLVAICAGTLAAHAGEIVVSKVPFEFTIGDKTFPAGEYQFQVDQLSVRVRSMDFSTSAIAMCRRGGDAVVEGPSMKFNVYGDQRFLSLIQTSKGTAVTLDQGSRERVLAKAQGAASSVALARSAEPRD